MSVRVIADLVIGYRHIHGAGERPLGEYPRSSTTGISNSFKFTYSILIQFCETVHKTI